MLRHTGPAFVEDPLRVLRAFQLAARFDFTLAPETAALCRRIAHTFAELPVERVWGEWEKWAVKATRPSRGLDVLEETGWLAHFPEIAALRGTPQEPEWHPEGDVFDHTRHCLDALVRLAGWREADAPRRRLLSLAVLAHDFGKPATTIRAERRGALRWISPGHEPAGGPLAAAFLRRIGAPLDLDAPVSALVMHHLLHHRGNEAGFTAPQVRRLARKLAPATIDDVALVMTADSLGRPPKDASGLGAAHSAASRKGPGPCDREGGPPPADPGPPSRGTRQEARARVQARYSAPRSRPSSTASSPTRTEA